MKEIKRRHFLQLSTKGAIKKSTLQDTHILVPYFIEFNFNKKFNTYSIFLKCIFEYYIRVQRRKKSGKEISNFPVLKIRL